MVVNDESAVRPTPLGRAVLASSLGPVDGLAVFAELARARHSVALDTDLHLVHMVTPIYLDVGDSLDWFRYLELYQGLSANERHVADLVGVEERFIMRCVSGAVITNTRRAKSETLSKLIRHRRFYTALALHCLVKEDGLAEDSNRFQVNRCVLQGLMQQAATYAGKHSDSNDFSFFQSFGMIFSNRDGDGIL